MADATELTTTIRKHLAAGGTVVVSTAARATQYTTQHADWFAVNAAGNLTVQHGKRRNQLSIGDRPTSNTQQHTKDKPTMNNTTQNALNVQNARLEKLNALNAENARMTAAFATVCRANKIQNDWKAPIDAWVPAIGAAELIDSVEYMTATPAKIVDCKMIDGVAMVRIVAIGYRAGPAN